jgi:hypothetical protein
MRPDGSTWNNVMSSGPQLNPQDTDELEAAVDQAIAARGGDMRSTDRMLIVANAVRRENGLIATGINPDCPSSN